MKSILAIMLILSSYYLVAQVPHWEQLSLDQSMDISNIEKDSLGFIWLTSGNGLYRFDGLSLDEKYQFPNELITAMKINSDEDFFLGTNEGSAVLFNPYDCSANLILEKSDFKNITNLYFNDENNFLLLSYGKGLLMSINGEKERLSYDNGLMSNEVYDVAWLDGKYYVSNDQGIQLLKTNKRNYVLDTYTIMNGLPDLVITNLEVDEGNLWFTDYRSNVGFIDQDGVIRNIPYEGVSKIHDLLLTNGRVFVSNDDGLFQIENNEWKKKYPIDGSKKVEFIEIDEEENLWIKKDKNSLVKGNLQFQKQLSGLENVRAISKIENTFLIGNEKGLFRYDGGIRSIINDKNITFLIKHKDHLLVGTFSEGVLVYDHKFKLIDHKMNWRGIPNESVLGIVSIKDDIYVSSLSGVMKFQLREGKLEVIESLSEKIGYDYVYSMIAKENFIFFGTDRNGLIKWDLNSDEVVKIKTFDNGDKIGSVYSITLDDDNDLWFTSTQKSIGNIKKGKVDFRSTSVNISEDYTSISALSDGNLLLVREGSIDLLNPKTFEMVFFDQASESVKEAEYLNAVVNDDELSYFVHAENVYVYSPNKGNKTKPGLIIDKILVNLSEVANQHIFKEDENNIEFNYKGVWLTDPGKISYLYKLEGFDDGWRATKNNTVSFPKLVPGHYTFKLKASQNGLFGEQVSALYEFKIKAFWYNRTVIRFLIFLLGAFIFWSIYINREKRKLEKQDLEKLKIENQLSNLKNQLNPHFLFNGFNTLIGLIEEDKPNSIAFVVRMTDFYRSMLELGKLDMVPLQKEMELLDQYIDILKARFNGQLIINRDVSDLQNYSLPPYSLQLLMENAVKHNVVSSKKPLEIRIIKKGDEISFWNKKNQLMSSPKGTKTGLDNIKRRFTLAGLEVPTIKETEDTFEVILKMKIL